jgi:hypothetical protein
MILLFWYPEGQSVWYLICWKGAGGFCLYTSAA